MSHKSHYQKPYNVKSTFQGKVDYLCNIKIICIKNKNIHTNATNALLIIGAGSRYV